MSEASVARRRRVKPAPIKVSIVRRLEEMLEVAAVRSIVYMGEQKCPFEEEFDGNDFAAATHLIARRGREPIGVMRIRWFGEFAKFERVAVIPHHRGGEAAMAMVRMALELSARKGYRKAIAHIQARLLPFWKRATRGTSVRERQGRPRFMFSDFEYVELETDLVPPANAIGLDTPAMVLLRPEGDWDRPGILDRSIERAAGAAQRGAR